MPVREPGYKPVRSRLQSANRARRTIVASLSLTAMVDLFTVLTVFLLQNYNVTGVTLQLPKEVTLPAAKMSEELTPANVVTVTKDKVLVGNRTVANVTQIRENEKWLIPELRDELRAEISEAKNRKVTLQADRDVEFSVLKRVIYSATEAGAGEVNFAVLKKIGDARN